VNFKLSPAIRGPEHTHAGFSCVDENNCDEEQYFLCANSVGGGVDFLACMDSSTGAAKSKAQKCAASSSLSWPSISSCFSGNDGKKLLKQAALYFDTKFPKPQGVPTIQVNGKSLQERDYASVIKALCATGIKAGACNGEFVVV
jgi:hypothetical protein